MYIFRCIFHTNKVVILMMYAITTTHISTLFSANVLLNTHTRKYKRFTKLRQIFRCSKLVTKWSSILISYSCKTFFNDKFLKIPIVLSLRFFFSFKIWLNSFNLQPNGKILWRKKKLCNIFCKIVPWRKINWQLLSYCHGKLHCKWVEILPLNKLLIETSVCYTLKY